MVFLSRSWEERKSLHVCHQPHASENRSPCFSLLLSSWKQHTFFFPLCLSFEIFIHYASQGKGQRRGSGNRGDDQGKIIFTFWALFMMMTRGEDQEMGAVVVEEQRLKYRILQNCRLARMWPARAFCPSRNINLRVLSPLTYGGCGMQPMWPLNCIMIIIENYNFLECCCTLLSCSNA